MPPREEVKTSTGLSMVSIILFLRAFKPHFAKMRQRSPLRNFITFLAKKQAPIHVSAVSSSLALMSFARYYSLGGSKRGLYLVSFTNGPLLVIRMRVILFLGRSAPRTVVAIDVASLDILPVFFSKIKFVCLYLLGKYAETHFIEFHLSNKVG